MNLLQRALEILGLGTAKTKRKKVPLSRRHRAYRQVRARQLLFEQVEDRRVLAIVGAAAQNPTVTEGSPAVIYFNVSPPSSSPITVNYQTVAGTAAQNVDYQGVTGTATIAPGQSFATVSVSTLTDSLTESAETFSVTITGATGATVGTASATITINDGSGGSGGGTVSVAALSSHYSEGGTAGFRITRSVSGAGSVTVNYQTVAGTAIQNTDYQGTSGSVTIPANQSYVDVSVTTLNDFSNEQGETFSLQITSATGATVSTSQNSAAVTIDDVPFVLPTVTVTGGTIVEGGTFTPTIVVDNGTAGSSFTYSINWGDGSQATYGTSNTPSHVYVDDNPTATPSDNYTITVTAIWPGNGPTVSGTGTVTVNNAPPEIEIQVIDPVNPNLPGGEIGNGDIAFLRIYITDQGIQDMHTVLIEWGDDTDETVSVTPSALLAGYIELDHLYPPNPSGETTYPFHIAATVTDDDGGTDSANTTLVAVAGVVAVKPEVWLEAVDSEASEVKFDPGSFKIHRSGATTSALVVRLQASGSAIPGYDYESAFGSWHVIQVTIPKGADSTTFTLTPRYDSLDEPTEDATFTIISYWYYDTPYTIRPSGGDTTIAIADGYGICTVERVGEEGIVEDINAGVFFGFNYSYLQFEVTLWGSSVGSTWTVPVTFSGSATKGTDYSTDVGANIQINASQHSISLTHTGPRSN